MASINSIRFKPGDKIRIFSDKSGDTEITYLLNYEYLNESNESYLKYRDEIYIGFPAVQMYNGTSYGYYVNSEMTYHVLLKLESYEGYIYYKRFPAYNILNYVSVNSLGTYYYMVKLSELIPNPVKGEYYSFMCYAEYMPSTTKFSTRDDEGSDAESNNKFLISNVKQPYFTSIYKDGDFLNFNMKRAYSENPSILKNGREKEIYEIVAIPDNNTRELTKTVIEDYTNTLLGSDKTRRIFTVLDDSYTIPKMYIAFKNNIPSSGSYIRMDKLLEYGTNGVLFGLNLIQTLSSETSTSNETSYIYSINNAYRNNYWYNFKIDNNMNYSEVYISADNFSLNNSISYYSESGFTNYYSREIKGLYAYCAINSAKIKFDFVSDYQYFKYSGNIEFILKHSWIDYEFKNTDPIFEINLSDYKNRLVYNKDKYFELYVRKIDTNEIIYTFKKSLKSNTNNYVLWLYVDDSFHNLQYYSSKLISLGNNKASFYLNYKSNLLINSEEGTNEIYREKIYLVRNLIVTVRNDTTGNSYTYDNSSAGVSDYIEISNITLNSGLNEFTITVKDRILNKVVSTIKDSINNVSEEDTIDDSEERPLLSISNSRKSIAVNEYASSQNVPDECFYVNGTLVVEGNIFYNNVIDDSNYYSYVIGNSSNSITLYSNDTQFSYISTFPRPIPTGSASDTNMQPFICSVKNMGNKSLYDLYFDTPNHGLVIYRVLGNTSLGFKVLFMKDSSGNDVSDYYGV